MEKIVIHRHNTDPIIDYNLDNKTVNRDKIGIKVTDLWRSSDASTLDINNDEIIFRTVTFNPNTQKILFHKTNSIDFAYIIEGEIDLVLSNSRVSLKTGDFVIQDRNSHAWVNKSNNSCKILFTMKSLNGNTSVP